MDVMLSSTVRGEINDIANRTQNVISCNDVLPNTIKATDNYTTTQLTVDILDDGTKDNPVAIPAAQTPIAPLENAQSTDTINMTTNDELNKTQMQSDPNQIYFNGKA
jgi:hypothetical protein